MKFAEFSVGQVIHCGPASLTERQITDFARDYDPQWFHTDPQRAADSTWQGLIASGWQSCGVAMRMVCDEILADSESFGSPGLAYLKWENPVRPGDALKLRVDVLDVRVARGASQRWASSGGVGGSTTSTSSRCSTSKRQASSISRRR